MPPSVEKTLEIERAVNLLNGFGWEKVLEEIKGDKIALTFEKPLQSPALAESVEKA